MKSLRRTISPIMWMCIGYVLGITSHAFLSVPLYFLVPCVVLLIIILMLAVRRVLIIMLLLTLAFLFGNGYMNLYTAKPVNNITHYYPLLAKGPVEVQGVIVSEMTVKKVFRTTRHSFILQCEQIMFDQQWQKTHGKVLVQMYRPSDLQWGDRVILKGKLHPPFEYSENQFSSYVDYLANRGIEYLFSIKKSYAFTKVETVGHYRWRKMLASWRQQLTQIFDHHLTPNEAGVMRAVILGDRTTMPRHVKELFIRTGTAHVLAMSGLHVGIIAAIFAVFVQMLGLPYKIRYAVIIIILIGFSFLTGLRPSIVRALIMAGIIFGSYILERPAQRWNNAFLAAFGILLYNPRYIYDIGFQLSFACIFSIFTALEILPKSKITIQSTRMDWFKKFVIDSVSISTAIWIGVTGLTVLYFNVITPVSILVNLWAVPMTSVIVLLGLGLILMHGIAPFLAGFCAYCIKLSLNFLVATLFLAEHIPGGYFYIKIVNVWYIVVYYIFMVILIGIWVVKKKRAQSKGISLTKP